MASYANLAKLGRVKLPPASGQSDPRYYALVDVDGRAMLAPNFSSSSSYVAGDYVIYGDNLYRFNSAHSGAWTGSDAIQVTAASEIKRALETIAGGIHYRGKTQSALYEGSTQQSILLNGSSTATTVEAGDMVTEDVPAVATAYAASTAYSQGDYISYDGAYYQANEAITAAQNTSWSAIQDKVSPVRGNPMFIWAEGQWTMLSGVGDGLGDLAFKDSASGTYTKPTGSGSVTLTTYGTDKRKLSTTTITGTNGTVNASNITDVATGTFATANATATTVAVADAESTRIGNADVGDSIEVGTSLSGTTTFVTSALKSASLGGTTTFNTDAIKAAALTGTTTFTTEGVTTDVNGDCLEFSYANTNSVGISTTPASTATVTISTENAGSTEKGTVGLGKTSITPAKSVSASSATIRGVSGTTDVRGVSGTASAVTGVTYSPVTPAAVAASATTVATGQLETGTDIVVGLTTGTTSASVSVGTTTDTVTVK